MLVTFDNFCRNVLVEEAVEDRVGAGGGHPEQVEHWEPDHHHLAILSETNNFFDDTKHSERQPTRKCRLNSGR